MKIATKEISSKVCPYIVAEMSANHNGSIEAAFEIIRQAKLAGADAVKIQTYRPDTITLPSDKPEFVVKGGLWDSRTLFDLYEEAHLPWEWHEPLFEFALEENITIFSSPFDFSAVDLLEKLNAVAYKVASFEAIDLPLVQYVASTGKPVIISTGMCDEIEIGEAVDAARTSGCEDLLLLHCVSGYPAPADEYNVRTIPDLKARFGCEVGLSDHTLDNATAIASVALGACLIEKHFTLNKMGGGPDDSFSLEPDELRQLCDQTKVAFNSLGDINYHRRKSERPNLTFRRSLYVVEEVKAGEKFTAQNVRSVRPGFGLAPKLLPEVLGRQAKGDIPIYTALSWDHIV